MLRTLKLLLPALIPSWRFFDAITPSPRLEFALLKNPEDPANNWQEFRPRPAQLSLKRTLISLFWNPHWNESLFLVSCAERLVNEPTDHSHAEILKRLRREIVPTSPALYLQFRLVFVSRDGAQLKKDIWYLSPVHSPEGTAT
jgi:hypothetical protein